MDRISTGMSGCFVLMFFSSSNPSGPLSDISTIMMSGRGILDGLQRRVHVLRLATDRQICLLIDEQRQALAHDRMIVNQKYGLLLGGRIRVGLY